ncbi:MAG: glycosyltransferase [Bacteroidales bacterium]|nr:glycosyltransferase [Bacteroidales bacterium]
MTEKMTIPTVSVIVPNYNHEKYLGERMASILAQTFSDFEIIILDDCSTDDSRKIIESYRMNPKISKIIYNDKNSGNPFLQWEKGVNQASGEFIWIAESDDVCTPDLIETLIKPLQEDSGCVISYCRSTLTDENGNKIGHHILQKKDDSGFKMEGRKFLKERMIEGNAILNASAVLFRKSAFENISREFLEYKYLGDIIVWSEIASKGYVCYCAREMNLYRQHSKSQTATGKNAENRLLHIQESRRRYDYFLKRRIMGKWHFRIMEIGILSYSLSLAESEIETQCIKKTFDWKLLWPIVIAKLLKDKIFHRNKIYRVDEIVRC